MFPISLAISILFCYSSLFGQVENKINSPNKQLLNNVETKLNTSKVKDIESDKVNNDTLIYKKKGDIETNIDYFAKDSININTNQRIIHLFGESKIKYGKTELTAEEITIDYGTSIVSAFGKKDSLGKRIGYPIFISEGEKYETEKINYNYSTKRARISEVVTKQGDGLLRGTVVFKNEENNMLSIHNTYTTCDLPSPHYGIVASKAKAIPGDKVVTGPFHMEVNGVPLPLVFPFGMFPSQRKKTSGVIIPTYGEERMRGFFLRNGGYFFDINEYVKLTVTGEVYSRGSSAGSIATQYNKRYKYNGNLTFNVTSNFTSTDIENRARQNDFRLNWSHSPQSKGTGRFSASVNVATNTFTSNNFIPQSTNLVQSQTSNTSSTLNSNVSYTKSIGKMVTLGVSLVHGQSLVTKVVNISFPSLNLTVNNIYPFKNSKIPILQKLNTRYTMVANNQITNNLGRISKVDNLTDSIAPFNFQTLPSLFEQGKKGIKHSIPLSTSFTLLKYLSFTTSFDYNEIWYFDKLKWGLDEKNSPVIKGKIDGFNRVSNYSASVNLTTRIYGTVFFKKSSGVQAIRHVLNPSVGFSYSPDFSKDKYGYYENFVWTNGQKQSKSVHEGYLYGSSSSYRSESMSFGINNTFEMKVKSKKDTVAKKVPIFNSLSISSSYNFAADSFKLAPFSIAANTNILNQKVNLNINAGLDPYRYVTVVNNEKKEKVETEIRSSNYAWESYTAKDGFSVVKGKKGVGRITSASFALSTNFNPKGQKRDNSTREKVGKANINESDKDYILKNLNTYIDFEIPWNLRLSYNLTYSHGLNSPGKISTHTVILGGDVSLSKKWKIQYNTGYDIEKKDITQTTLTIARDLHCWDMSLSWTPFGKFQSYSFHIGIKSAILKDLKLDRNRSFFDN